MAALRLRRRRDRGCRRLRTRLMWTALGILVPLALAGGIARAADPEAGFSVRARHFEYDRGQDVYVAAGDVEIEQAGERLQADWVAFSPRSGRGVASGHVRIEQGAQRVEAESMQFEVEGLRGALSEASIDTGPGGFRIQAREIARTGARSWRVLDGRFTTCRCPEPGASVPWQIEATETEVELGGYGWARNARFEVQGIPVLWLPRMLYPVKTERETGLLMPELGFGGPNGVQVGVPVFWAARPELGVIWTPRHLEERGFKNDLELEYVQGQRSGGSLYGSFLRDDGAATRNRWAAAVQQDQHLPRDWRLRSDLKFVSDNLYLHDFDDLGRYRRDVFLRSQIFGFRHFGADGRTGVTGALHYADDVLPLTRADRDGLLLQRWPELSLRVLPGDLGRAGRRLGLEGGFEAGYAHFASLDDAPATGGAFFLDSGLDGRAGSGDAGEGDGLFEEGEPLRDRGERLVLAPSVARPLRLGTALELRPELGYTQTLYSTPQGGFDEQGLLAARADLGAALRGSFGGPLGAEATHLARPFLSWVLLRPRSQTGSPVFVPASSHVQQRLRQLEPGNLVRDASDRVAEANRLALGLGNRFYSGRHNPGLQRLVTDLTFSFAHDFDTGELGRWLIDGRSRPASGDLQLAYGLAADAEDARIEEGLMDVSAGLPVPAPFASARLGARYRFLRDVPRLSPGLSGPGQDRVQQVDAHAGLWLTQRIQLRCSLSWSLEDAAVLSQGGGVGYVSGCRCWAIGAEVYDDRTRGVQVDLRATLLGLGDDGHDPFARRRGIGSGDLR